jgi:cytochrome b561
MFIASVKPLNMPSTTENIQQLLEQHFTGALDQTFTFIKLGVYSIGVLFAGLVLWRITTLFMQKKMKQRRKTTRFSRKLK